MQDLDDLVGQAIEATKRFKAVSPLLKTMSAEQHKAAFECLEAIYLASISLTWGKLKDMRTSTALDLNMLTIRRTVNDGIEYQIVDDNENRNVLRLSFTKEGGLSSITTPSSRPHIDAHNAIFYFLMQTPWMHPDVFENVHPLLAQ